MNPSQPGDFNPLVIATIMAGTTHANDIPECPEDFVLHRVWTLIDREKLEAMGPKHNVSTFLEDKVHDWQIRDGKLHYYSRVAAIDEPVEVVFEFAPKLELERQQRETRERRTAKRPK